ncbi:MAG: FHA domain-containing protein [Chloroflexota bacterium]|nr:FHA domain-containing protein [Chloroflexota bacterium]
MPTFVENQRFERYRIVRWLGNGVSSESYEAEDTALQRAVTLKLLFPWSSVSDAARRQFFRDMQGISLLNHPFITSILDYGESGNRLYVTRHYADHGSLLSREGRLWFQAPLAVSDAIHYGYQLAQALDHIHRHELVHGALTLSNILVAHEPNLEQDISSSPFLLSDTGLAGYVRHYGHPQITVLPTTAAPEQFSHYISPASDQFALATIIYFWLAGRPPYLGSPSEIEQLKLAGTVSPLFLLNSEVSLEQEAVIRRALNAQAEERYSSVLAFAEALLTTLPSSSLPDKEAQTHLDAEISVAHQSTQTILSEDSSASELITAAWSQTNPAITFEINPNQPPTQPVPDPIPPAPDIPQPIPSPAPEPLPEPAPEPLPTPAPEPLPVPAPDPLPGPDIPSPMPQPGSPSIPQVDFSIEAGRDAKLLITYAGSYDLREFPLDQDEVLLGRAGSSDILLDKDELPSRHHAVIKHEGTFYVLYDLSSTLGVSVNGEQLQSETGYTLKEDDQITIGNYTLLFYLDAVHHEKDNQDLEIALPA